MSHSPTHLKVDSDAPIRTWGDIEPQPDVAGAPQEPNFSRTSIFREPIDISVPPRSLIPNFETPIVSIGTCLAHELADDMQRLGLPVYFKLESCHHFSPATMADVLERAAETKRHTEDDLYITKEGAAMPYGYKAMYASFYGDNKVAEALSYLDELVSELRKALAGAKFLMFTLGTSRVVRLRRNGAAAVRVRQIPASEWYTQLMTTAETVECLERMYSSLQTLCGDAPVPPIVLTVSPQRYLFTTDDVGTDPFVDNALNKSILRVAVSEFISRHPDRDVTYFPSYEIVLDELRSQETLSSSGDHAHVNKTTRPYVLKKFIKTFASQEVIRQLNATDLMFNVAWSIKNQLKAGTPPAAQPICDDIERVFASIEKCSGRLSEVLATQILELIGAVTNSAISGPAASVEIDAGEQRLLSLMKRGTSLLRGYDGCRDGLLEAPVH